MKKDKKSLTDSVSISKSQTSIKNKMSRNNILNQLRTDVPILLSLIPLLPLKYGQTKFHIKYKICQWTLTNNWSICLNFSKCFYSIPLNSRYCFNNLRWFHSFNNNNLNLNSTTFNSASTILLAWLTVLTSIKDRVFSSQFLPSSCSTVPSLDPQITLVLQFTSITHPASSNYLK